MGGDFEGHDEDKSNSAFLQDDLQVSVTVSAAVWHLKLGGGGVYVEVPGEVSPSGVQTDHRDDKKRAYTTYRSTFRDGRQPSWQRWHAAQFMNSVPRSIGDRDKPDCENMGSGHCTQI